MKFDTCEDDATVGRVYVYLAAILSTVASVMLFSAAGGPIWAWDYEWVDANTAQENFNYAEVISLSPWVTGFTAEYQPILNRTSASVPEDCKLSPGLLTWKDMENPEFAKYGICEKSTELYKKWGYRFCDDQSQYSVPSRVKSIKAFTMLTGIFTVISAVCGFVAPNQDYSWAVAATITSLISAFCAMLAIVLFVRWDYIDDLTDDNGAVVAMLACDQPGMEKQIIPVSTVMSLAPSTVFVGGVIGLQLFSAILYGCFGRYFVWDYESD